MLKNIGQPNLLNITKERIKIYLLIFVVLFLQFGICNIRYLGLVTDDWADFKPTYSGVENSFFSILKFKLDVINPGDKLARPLTFLFNPLQLRLFWDRPELHHVGMFLTLFVCEVLLYETLILLTGRKDYALATVLIFIVLPFHITTYYWLATRVSIYAFMLALLAILCLFSDRFFIRNIIGPLLFLFSISGYEIFLVFIPLFFYILFFTDHFISRSFKSKAFTLGGYLFSVALLFLYRKVVLSLILLYKMTKGVNIGLEVFQKDRFFSMFSNVYGKGLFSFFKNTVSNIFLIKNIEYWYLLLIVLLFISVYLSFSKEIFSKEVPDASKKKDNILLQSGLILITFGLLSLLPTGYRYVLGSSGDRINLVICLGISFLITYFIFRIPRNIAKCLFACLLISFTLINWTFLFSYIKSYEYQLQFIKHVQSLNIPENSLVYLDTDLDYFNNVPVLITRWGITGMLSYASGRSRVEYVGDWSYYKELGNDKTYVSKQYKDYIYKDPSIFFIRFNEGDTY